jgi:hypothetical protein
MSGRNDGYQDKKTGRGRLQGRWLIAALLATGGGLGCEGQGQEESVGGVEVERSPADAPISSEIAAPGSETDKALNLCITRSDKVSSVTVTAGDWGSWASCPSSCPEGSFAYGVNLKVEAWDFRLDETAMNGVQLNCNDRNTGAWTANVTSTMGPWGGWWGLGMCGGGVNVPLVGAQVQYQSPQSWGVDDTTANHMWGRCGLTSTFDLPLIGASGYGSWRTPVACPAGTAVCGITTRVEGSQGSGDDTALGGIKFECCKFCPAGQRACGTNLACLPAASCPSPVVR